MKRTDDILQFELLLSGLMTRTDDILELVLKLNFKVYSFDQTFHVCQSKAGENWISFQQKNFYTFNLLLGDNPPVHQVPRTCHTEEEPGRSWLELFLGT